MSTKYEPKSAVGRFINSLEETIIAILLGLMTLVTFINVVLRYGFNDSLTWGLEATTFLFAWLVLFGISYSVKVTAHLGVDALTNLFPVHVRRVLAIIAATICVAYAFLLTKGAWDYWANLRQPAANRRSLVPSGSRRDEAHLLPRMVRSARGSDARIPALDRTSDERRRDL